jgi:Spy/CpxP family protein refolding chaperone
MVLNVAFVAGAAWTLLSPDSPRKPTGTGIQDLASLKEALSLTPQQWEFFQKDRTDVLSQVQGLRTLMDDIRAHLWSLLATDQPDAAEIETTLARVLSVQGEAQRSVVNHLTRLRTILDEAQRKRFDEFLVHQRSCPMHQEACLGRPDSLEGSHPPTR